MPLYTLFAFLVLAGLLFFTSVMTCRLVVPDRVKRVATGMDRLLLFVPVLAAVVFAVLFLFVLKGRFYERLCHAALVLALWLYAARFYWMLISYFKNRNILVLSFIGMIVSTAAAILLTPLDRYVSLVHSFTGSASILPGGAMLAIFYAAAFLRLRKKENRG